MQNILRILFAVLVFGIACGPSYGWNDGGHMFIASVAYSNLTPATRARVDALLRLNPKYDEWIKTIPRGTSPAAGRQIIFMYAATWPDSLRRETGYVKDVAGAPLDLSIGYGDVQFHSNWHYLDRLFSTDGTALPPTEQGSLNTIIPALREVLKSTSTDSVKSYSLVWLTHLIGDAHQPVHCATRVSAAAPQGDAGANLIIVCDPQCGRRLHALWDALVGNPLDTLGQRTRAQSQAPIQAMPKGNARLAANLNSDEWIQESFEIAKTTVYAPPIGEGTGPFKLTTAYLATAKRVANERAVLAGMRLAKILNTELK